MAITIQQQPTTPNYSVNDLVFVLSSSSISETEFSFVVDVTVGTDTFRYRKQPNPTSRGVINLSRVIGNNLDFEVEALGVSVDHTYASQVKDFSIVFSEEFQDDDGDLVVQNALPAVTLRVIKGVVENDTTVTNLAPTIPAILSDVPKSGVKLHRSEDVGITTQSSGALVYDTITIPQDTSTSFTQDIGGSTYTFQVYDERSFLGETTFHWFNRKGGLDFYTANQEGTLSTDVSRLTAPSSAINVGFTTATNLDGRNVNVWKSQTNTYRVDYNETHTKNTEWLNEEMSAYVSGIFDSPCVYVKNGETFRPVEILNSSYSTQRAMRNETLENFTIMYRYSNNKKSI